jgi:myosin-5
MKYLAALSQRSVLRKRNNDQRAYLKVQQQQQQQQHRKTTTTTTTTTRNSATKSTSSPLPTWVQQRSASKIRSIEDEHNHENDDDDSESMMDILSGSTIEAQVLQSNPILESFGNARTVRNDNSSRFGKFIEIQFTDTGKLVGAQIETYLLEKVRLVRQNPGERNYHIFYQILSIPSARELSRYFLAPTATPEDFKMTSSGTNHRRDGISDRETFQELVQALTVMKFEPEEISQIFQTTAGILHASNLQFRAAAANGSPTTTTAGTTISVDDACQLDRNNVHLEPVCSLLGISVDALEDALCRCVLQAGHTEVTRSLNVEQAANGLEALLKETYGALFGYLVQKINQQIAVTPTSTSSSFPQYCCDATIGVLDIFGFESFTVNSFEQLCINYCNETLQQQFNAFFLQNEQAEYEREGIEWSFIEFPENQDVLDLMEKRGSSILSILDDQCRAPGPSDKAFALAVYAQCASLPRFSASRKQQASLQFSIHHYAGPVEYTVTGFTAKNKDELRKETVYLLSHSDIPFVRELAQVMEQTHHQHPPTGNPGDASPRKLHRADSSVGRATVGGQFRSQLKSLRRKIDRASPHYIRCLKPNDLLVPDHFDIAIVAEQLRCGGILEAVRVARAGFTQHYAHADFLRRYRSLAWKELSNKALAPPPSPMGGSSPIPPQHVRRGSYRRSTSHLPPVAQCFLPKTPSKHNIQDGNSTSSNHQTPKKEKKELTATEAKAQCRDLIKVLYRKIIEEGVTMEGSSDVDANSGVPPSPIAKAKTYSTPTKAPSWSKKPATPPTTPNSVSTNPSSPTATRSWKRGTTISSSDFVKIGIQMGKTKIFLRHKAFEALERIRSIEQTKAATLLNSMFRRYLARIAYLPYRDAMRQAIRARREQFEQGYDNKETKEQDYDDDRDRSFGIDRSKSCSNARWSLQGLHPCTSVSLVDKWTESQIRDAIHNPIPRHEWGKHIPDASRFKWVLREGLWVKNYDLVESSSSLSADKF